VIAFFLSSPRPATLSQLPFTKIFLRFISIFIFYFARNRYVDTDDLVQENRFAGFLKFQVFTAKATFAVYQLHVVLTEPQNLSLIIRIMPLLQSVIIFT